MNPLIKKQLLRLGFSIKENEKSFSFEDKGRKFEIPSPINSIIQSLNTTNDIFYYDHFQDNFPSEQLKICPIKNCTEYPCLENRPYFSFLINRQYSYYLLSADDTTPENPTVYFLDHDAWDYEKPSEIGLLSDFLAQLFTQKQANEWLKENEADTEVEEIALYLAINRVNGTLTRLQETYNKIVSLKGLEAYQAIKILNFHHNQIVDISPLKNMTFLSEVNLSHNNIREITALANKQDLHSLNLSNNQIVDISPLKTCPNLKCLDISQNPILDFSVLEGLNIEIKR